MHRKQTRLGLIFFSIYTAIYTIYVVLNAFNPSLMETTPIAGVNLAILFGFALIVIAFVMSLLYGYLCRTSSDGKSDTP